MSNTGHSRYINVLASVVRIYLIAQPFVRKAIENVQRHSRRVRILVNDGNTGGGAAIVAEFTGVVPERYCRGEPCMPQTYRGDHAL